MPNTVTRSQAAGFIDELKEMAARKTDAARLEEVVETAHRMDEAGQSIDACNVLGMAAALRGDSFEVERRFNAALRRGGNDAWTLGNYAAALNILAAGFRARECEASCRQAWNGLERRRPQFFDAMPGYFYTLLHRPDGSYDMPLACNAIRDLYDLGPEAEVNDYPALLALVHPDDAVLRQRKLDESERDLSPFHAEYRIVLPQKGERWIEAHALPKRTADGGTRWDGFMHDITERKKMEETLAVREREARQQAQFQQSLLSGMRDAGIILVVVENGHFVYTNDHYVGCNLGYAEGQLPETVSFIELIHPDDRPRIAEMHRDRLAGKPMPRSYEIGALGGDGSRREYEFHVTLVPDTDPPQTQLLALDIAERKRAQLELQRREREFRTLVENTPDVVVRYDRECRRTYVNPAWARVNGIPVRDVLGKSPQELSVRVKPISADFERMLRGVMETGQPDAMVLNWRDEAGKPVNFELRAIPEFDSSGEAVSVLTVARDISEHRRMESELALREQAYRSLTENLPDNIARMDTAGRVLYSNSIHQRSLGKPAAEMLGKTFGELFPDGRYAPVERAIAQVVATGQPVLFVRQPVPMESGETRIHDVNLVPERDANGNVVSVLGIGRDMTELYRLQDEIGARERQLRALADSSPGMMGAFHSRPDGSVCMPYVSPNIEELFGLRPQDVADDAAPLLALSHPDDAQRVSESIAESARDMTVWHEEYRIIHPTRGERWMESHTRPEPHPDGGVVWYGYVHDITGRKRIEEQLKLKEFALDRAHTAAYLMAEDGLHFVYVNDAACRSLGYSRDELLSLTLPDIDPYLPPEDANIPEKLLAEGGADSFESRHKRRDGSSFPVEVNVSVFEYQGRMLALSLVSDITERKRMESELRLKEFVLDQARVGVYLIGDNARITYVNDEACRALGYSREELLTMTTMDINADHSVEASMDVHRKVLDGDAYTFETRHVRRDGSLLPVEVRASALEYQGKVIGVALAADITARKRAEAELKMFRHAVDQTGEAIYLHELSRGFVDVNDTACRMLGYPREELLGMSPLDIDPDATREAIERSFRMAEDGRVYKFESRHRAKDGRIFDVELTGSFFVADGVRHAVTAVRDITEQKQARRRLELLERAIDQAGDALLLLDAEARFQYVNETACRMLGYSREELTGMSPPDIDPDVTLEQCRDMTRSGTGAKRVFETRHRAKDGSFFPVEVSGISFEREGEKFSLVSARDITARKHMEAALKESEARYRHHFNLLQSMLESASRVSVFALDREYRYLSFNKRHRDGAKRLRGTDIAIGMNMVESIGDEVFREFCRRGFDRVLAGESVFVESKEAVVRDGHPVYEYNENYGSPIYGDGGEIVGLTVFAINITERKRIENVLRFIADPGNVENAEGFLAALARFLGEELGVRYVLIDRLDGDPGIAETVALYAGGGIVPNMRYALKDTPCDNVIGQRVCCYPQGVQALFPQDKLLVEMGAESYAGIPLWDSVGKPIGLIAVMDDAPIGDAQALVNILQLAGPRVAAELERERSERIIRAREQEFRSLAENSPDNIARWDREGRLRYSNPVHQRSLGKSAAEMTGKNHGELFPDGRFAEFEATMARIVASGVGEVLAQVLVPGENGEMRQHEVKLVPEFDADGKVTGVLGLGRDMTDIYRMQETIAAREQEFRSLAESSPDFIVRYDLEGRHRYLNTALLRLLGGGGIGEVAGLRPSEVWPDGRFDQLEQAAARAVEEEQPQTIELSVPFGDGRIFYHQIFVVPERDASGGLAGTIAFGRDVTAIRETEHQLAHFFDNLPGLAYTFHLSKEGQASFPYVSQAVEEIYGLKPEAARGDFSSIHLLAHPEDRLLIEAAIAESARTMAPFRVESRVCRPGQPERWLDVRSVPEAQPDGSILWYGLMLDITERKRIENVLRRSQEVLADAQKIARLGSWDWDVVGDRVEWSEMACEIYTPDHRPAEPGFEDFKSSLHPDDVERVVAAVQSAFERDTPFDLDHRVVSASKGVRTVHAQGRVFRDASGKPVRMVGTVQDITERKRAEQALEDSRIQLRGLIAQREEAREEERCFVAREIHDNLGQILSGLRMSLSRFARLYAANSAEMQDHLRDTGELVDLAVQEVRNISAALRPVELEMDIRSALASHLERFGAYAGISCELHAGDGMVSMGEDCKLALFRIAQEALTNIARHAQAGKVEIGLRMEPPYCILYVRDDGIGFDTGVNKPKSFGLTGMRERAAALGGSVVVDSHPGKGTEITVRIPVQKVVEKS
ncbi:MAG TPA: PAS domain S-box protein [Gallionella sp.]|nr:PAS domain S-box protein [Gallionella sp.]